MNTKFSRSGNSFILGKKDGEFPKFHAPQGLVDKASALAHEQDLPLTEWLLNLVAIRVEGADMINSLHNSRINAIAGIGEVGGKNVTDKTNVTHINTRFKTGR